MISQNQFDEIKNNIKNYKYNSMEYTEYEEVKDYNILKSDENLILIYGFNEETKLNECVFAFNDYKIFASVVKDISKDTVISFIKDSWVDELKTSGFEMYAVWCSYFSYDLAKYKNDEKFEIASLSDYKEASEVTLSCKYQSRGFTGQSAEWMELWAKGMEPAAPEYAKDCSVLINKIDGKIAGVVCVGVYGHGSEKGPILWIRELAVNPDYQGKGIGRKLLGQAFNYGLQKGATRAFLLADECNYGAIHLYKSMGFAADENDREIDMIHK